MEDARARAVIERAASAFGWSGARPPPGRGKGFGFARYKNSAAYCAVAVEVAVDPHKGLVRLVRATAAIDSGQVVNPDGLRNQTEGGIIQSASWTLHEKVAFNRKEIRSFDWSTYPILRFDGVPESIDVHIIDRPGDPHLGSGEAAAGPTAGAIGNAVASATGRRWRSLPLA
jgi:nicotinate dehydrogenase subunit B